MEAIILAGGLGTRLQSVVSDRPKALSLVANKPFLDYIIRYLQQQGVTKYIFSLGYLASQLLNFLNECYPDLNYEYFIEEMPLGTGGAIKKNIVMASTDNVLIVNADTYFDVPLQQMFAMHKETNATCTISLKEMDNFDRYGSVELDTDNTIVLFKEKKVTSKGLINGGYLIVNKKYYLAATENLAEIFSFEKDFLEHQLHKTLIKGFVADGYFIDIGIPEDFEKAQLIFIKNNFN